MLRSRVDDGWGQEVCRADVGEGPRLGKGDAEVVDRGQVGP